MGKYLVAEDRYVLINVHSDENGAIKDFDVDFEGLSTGEYATVLFNALIKKGVRLGIGKEELRDALCDAVDEIYEKMEEEEHE